MVSSGEQTEVAHNDSSRAGESGNSGPETRQPEPVISIIVAMAENRVIGIDNRLPWHLPDDMKWFRRHTLGKPVVMGRKTWESIGKPLPGRQNIVVTADPGFAAPGCTVVHSVEAALSAAAGAEEIMIMGGASFYEQLLPRTDRLYLTLVHAEVAGDTRFPELEWGAWREVERSDRRADSRNPYDYSFLVLERY